MVIEQGSQGFVGFLMQRCCCCFALLLLSFDTCFGPQILPIVAATGGTHGCHATTLGNYRRRWDTDKTSQIVVVVVVVVRRVKT